MNVNPCVAMTQANGPPYRLEHQTDNDNRLIGWFVVDQWASVGPFDTREEAAESAAFLFSAEPLGSIRAYRQRIKP